jgi:hypothetical protein
MDGQYHIIGKQSINISFDNLDDSFGMQDRIAELFYERIQPQMNELFNDTFGKEEVVFIERQEDDCETIGTNNWEDRWVELVLRRLTEQLRQVEKRKRPANESAHEFFFFLEHGYLPWNSRTRSLSQLESTINITSDFIRMMLDQISKDDRIAMRLLRSFEKDFIINIIRAVLIAAKLENNLVETLINEMLSGDVAYATVTGAIFAGRSPGEIEVSNLKKEMIKNIKEPKRAMDKKPQPKQLKKSAGEKEDVIYIDNAGLVIFHPLIVQLFEKLDFARKAVWVNEQMQQRAAIVLQYLANGNEKIEEFELVIPKIMTGLQTEDVLVEDVKITNREKHACDELTKQVIGYWTALKNTGEEAFRNAFIQRQGKLSRVDHGWLLQVERKAMDVLLGSLPWGIGVVRLPWMKEMIFTEWG